MNWCSWDDSNVHWTVSQTALSAVGVQERGRPPGIRTPTSRIKSPALCQLMLVARGIGGRRWFRPTCSLFKRQVPLYLGLARRPLLVLARGTAPRTKRLSAASVASPFARVLLVRLERADRSASAMSKQRSSVELQARDSCRGLAARRGRYVVL